MRKVGFWVLLLTLTPASWGLTLWGVDINGLELQSSYYMILNSVQDSAPDPFVNTLGFSVPFRFLGHWTFRPEVQFYTETFSWDGTRAYPVETMFDNVVILGTMLNPTVGYEFPLATNLSWAAEGGIGFLLRFPVFLNGTTAGDMALPITGWLMSGRFLYPDIGTSITWQFSPLLAVTARLQTFLPVFNLWTNMPFYDQLIFGGGLGVRFTF